MMFIHFLEDNPVIVWFIVLALLITVVPAAAALYRRARRIPAKSATVEPRESRFLGTQMDLAILVVGLLTVAAIVSWLVGIFF